MGRRFALRQGRRYPSFPSSGFAGPASLSGLLLWTRGDVVTQASNVVSSWTDKSGNGNHLAAIGTAQPTYVPSDAQYGGQPSISFNGANNFLKTASALTYGAFTLFMAMRADGVVTGFLFNRAAGPDYLYGTTGNTTSVNYAGGGSAYNLTAGWSTNATPRTIARSFDGTHAGDSLEINGVAQSLTSVSAGNPGTTGVNDIVAIMANNTGATFTSGTVAEVILYNRSLAAAEKANVTAYLRTRYGYY
jgi:hypothetical protein